VTFSESKATVHPAREICPGQDGIYWQNETGTTQQVVEVDGEPIGTGVTIPAGQGAGECKAPGTYTFGLQSNPGTRVIITADSK
jgi:hypothetical protein